MSKTPYWCLTSKNGWYYVIIYYYEDGKRKSKSHRTGIPVDAKTVRARKKQRSEAEAIGEQCLREYIQENDPALKTKQQMLADTARSWLKRQRGSKAAGTISSYIYCTNDIIRYFY